MLVDIYLFLRSLVYSTHITAIKKGRTGSQVLWGRSLVTSQLLSMEIPLEQCNSSYIFQFLGILRGIAIGREVRVCGPEGRKSHHS